MRTILLMAALAGCVHRPPLTLGERCAARGMALAGVNVSTSTSGAYVTDGQTGAYGRSYGYSEDVQCRMPTPIEACDVRRMAAAANIKLGFNTTWRNVTIGVGLILFILPGVVLYFVHDGKADATASRAAEARQSADVCDELDQGIAAEPATSPPPRTPERHVVDGERPMFCTTVATNPDIGFCSLLEERCQEARRHAVEELKLDYSECTARSGAACFNATKVIDNDRVTVCAPSVKNCEIQLADFKTNPDFTVTQDQCGIYRVKQ